MRSPKTTKKSPKVRSLRNRSARLWKRLRNARANVAKFIAESVCEPNQQKIPKPPVILLSHPVVPKIREPRDKTLKKQPNEKGPKKMAQTKQPAAKQRQKQQIPSGTVPPPPKTPQQQKSATTVPSAPSIITPPPPLSDCSVDSGICILKNEQQQQKQKPSAVPDLITPSPVVSITNGTGTGGGTLGVVMADQDQQRRSRSPRSPRANKLLQKDIDFCVYMIQQYGTDFEKMSQDKRNVFQDPPEMIARKLRIFRESPYFAQYEDSTGKPA